MPISAIREFLRRESSGGVLLLAAALLAMTVVNSPASDLYEGLLAMPIGVQAGPIGLQKPLLLWVNDGLMAVFFFLIGLEIKREVLEGELSTVSQAALPAVAALGGMLGPAIIYVLFNLGDAENLSGWAIPMATDIAFALGVLSLLGPRVPTALKVFLLALAILDDLGAIIVIALFYTADLAPLSLALAGGGLVVLVAFNRLGVGRLAAYVIVGIFIWTCVLKSGVHATLAGTLVALTIPLRPKREEAPSLLRECESNLHAWVSFGIMPLFAFANSGLSLAEIGVKQLAHPVTLGVILGLFAGKQAGVMAALWILRALGLGRLPAGVTWLQMYGVVALTGIGFTMSLFIGSLAFGQSQNLALVRLGVIVASLLSAALGLLILVTATGTSGPIGGSPGTSKRPVPEHPGRVI